MMEQASETTAYTKEGVADMQLDNKDKTLRGSRICAWVCALVLALACAFASGVPMAFAEEGGEAPAEAQPEAEAQAAAEQAEAEAKAAAEQAEAEAKAAAEQAEAEAKAAAEQAEAEDKEKAAKLPDKSMTLLGNDLVWFGRDTKVTEYKAANDFLGAGETVTVTDSTIAGSIRME